jgi:hypothetical protein
MRRVQERGSRCTALKDVVSTAKVRCANPECGAEHCRMLTKAFRQGEIQIGSQAAIIPRLRLISVFAECQKRTCRCCY